MTEISIHGKDFYINGHPTYEGRFFEGHRIEGLLFNVRAVQAIFDDANPQTRPLWAYPDTNTWDADRNTTEFCEALADWAAHGVLAFTVNLQGGGPLYIPEIYYHYDNNGFTSDGHLKPAYAARLERVIARADELGLVAIVGMFYWMMLRRMEGEEAIWRAAYETCEFLIGTGRHNILVEIANEIDVIVDHTSYALFRPGRQAEMISTLCQRYPELLYSTSGGGVEIATGRGMPPAELVRADDYILLHGNGSKPHQLEIALDTVTNMRAYRIAPKPIVINEDSPALANMEVAWRKGVSWGYYDQGWHGQNDDPWADYAAHPRYRDDALWENLSGFQTPPVNWHINTPFKRAFFQRVAQITGAPASAR